MFSRLTKKWFFTLASILLVGSLILAGCSNPAPATTTTPKTVITATPTPTAKTPTSVSVPVTNLNGTGATFPAPLYTKWFDEYNKLTGVKINYQPIGSSGGIKAITEGTADFGGSDGIMTDAQISAAETAAGPILHIPMTSGAVAVIFNLTGISSGQLKLNADVLARIYLKAITKWNDPAITVLNPGLNLPNSDIAVVHRSDGSGTTYIFTNYLSKISNDWKIKVGNATSVNWPGDIGGQGNAGVAGQVQQTPGAIGYVELAYAIQNKLPWATLQNSAGNWVQPGIASATAASDGVTLPDDMKIMVTNSSNPNAYPIVGFTWILAYVNQKDQAKGVTLARVLWWAIHDGQQYCQALDYAPLSSAAVAKAEREILSMKYQEQPILTLAP